MSCRDCLYELKICRIETSKYTLKFKQPYIFSVKEEGTYSFEDPFLSLYAFGDTLELLQADIFDEFSFMWDFIAREDDENLTLDAKEIKRWLNDNIIQIN